MTAKLSLDLTDRPSPDDVKAVGQGLDAHNEPFSGSYEPRPIAAFLRAGDGRVVGGIVADTVHERLKIDMLWVDQALRGLGWGSRLLGEAEREAVARGCRRAVLDTTSFQAPDFYRRHGYRIIGTVRSFHEGHDLHYMIKDLV